MKAPKTIMLFGRRKRISKTAHNHYRVGPRASAGKLEIVLDQNRDPHQGTLGWRASATYYRALPGGSMWGQQFECTAYYETPQRAIEELETKLVAIHCAFEDVAQDVEARLV